jgi:hypothetical protein
MQVHIKRRHKDGHWSVPTGKPSFSPNQKEAAETSSQYMYGPPYRLNTSADEGKNTETSLDKNLENFRKFHDFRRLLDESGRNLTADSWISEIFKLLMIQIFSNLHQGKLNVPTRKVKLLTGYQVSFCDKCLLGSFRPVFYPIEVEGATKLVHNCKDENFFADQTEEEFKRIKRQAKDLLGERLLKAVTSRIGQGDARLKAVKLSQQAFSEDVRKKLKLPASRSLIEERDSIKVNLPCDREGMDYYWFCRAIREAGKNNSSTKISKNELIEFLRIAKSTYGVFADIVRKDYFLIYLVL